MSLWQEYQKNTLQDTLQSGVSDSLRPAIYAWLYEAVKEKCRDPYDVAVSIKNKFRIQAAIPSSYPNSYATPPGEYRLTVFLMNIADSSPDLFFVIIDYLIQSRLANSRFPFNLGIILDQAGHEYTVIDVDDKKVLSKRLPNDQQQLMEHILINDLVYASEFQDAFKELYGPAPNYTRSAGEAFQAIESALKYFFGEDKGQNLGALYNWLKTNPDKWEYTSSSDAQDDAADQFLSLVNFVNKSYRKTKHGQADKKLEIHELHAETIMRAVALLIFELENVIRLKP